MGLDRKADWTPRVASSSTTSSTTSSKRRSSLIGIGIGVAVRTPRTPSTMANAAIALCLEIYANWVSPTIIEPCPRIGSNDSLGAHLCVFVVIQMVRPLIYPYACIDSGCQTLRLLANLITSIYKGDCAVADYYCASLQGLRPGNTSLFTLIAIFNLS
jgi:hypothetical protein